MSINIINQYVNFSKKCINNYFKLIMKKRFDQDIFNEFIKVYIDVRYYDIYPREKKIFVSNITYHLSKKAEELITEEQYERKDDIEAMFLLFSYMYVFDNVISCDSAKEVIKKLNKFRIDKFGYNDERFENEMFELVKSDLLRKKQYISNFNSKEFNLIYSRTNIRNLYNVNIEYNLKFPKIYSRYAIDKAISSNDINEHRLFVIYPIVVSRILSNIIDCDFKKIYLVDYNLNLNNKDKKLKRLYSLIDDDIAKEKIIIKLNFNDFIKNKLFFINKMRLGFNYAVVIDNKTNLESEDMGELRFFKYIIINQKHENFNELCNLDNVVVDR